MAPIDLGDPLDTPLADLDLPTRMRTVVERLGLRTVADLVAIDPGALQREPNLGRTSIAQTRALLEAHLGTSWNDAHARVADAPPTSPSSRTPRTWDDLAATLTPAQRALPLDAVTALPGRMRSFAARENLVTVGALVDVSARSLLAADNLGRASIAGSFAAIVEQLAHEGAASPHDASSTEAPPDDTSWSMGDDLLDLWRRRVAPLPPVDRIVLQHRAGVGTDALTLSETGEFLGVSRERVRQIEVRALTAVVRDRRWVDALHARVAAAVPDGAAPVDDVAAADPWLRPLRDEPAFARFVADRVLGGRWSLVVLDGVTVLSAHTAEAIDAAWRALHQELLDGHWPATRNDVDARVAAAGAPFGACVARVFAARAAAQRLDDPDDASRTLGYGTSRPREVVAYLRRAGGPVAIADLTRHFGSKPHLPDEVILLERGLVALVEHLDGFDEVASRVVPRCEAWMRAHGPSRQWSCDELRPAFDDEALPAWFGVWPLAAMFARSPRVRYVGRLVVSLPEVDGDRVHLRDAMVQALTDAGTPLPRASLAAQVRARRGAVDLSIAMALQKRPFVETELGVYGLLARDLPRGDEGAAQAVAWVREALTASGRGMTLRDALHRLVAHDPAFETWTLPMLRSVLRESDALQTALQGAVGLASWEGVRVPTRAELITQSLDAGGGRVDVEVLRARIAEVYGEAPTRSAIGWQAWHLGGRLSGPDLVRDGDGASGPASLPGIPPEAAVFFEAMRAEPAGDLDALDAAVDAYTQRLFDEAAQRPGVDLDAAVDAQRRSHALLARARHASDDAQRTASAAVRYFLHDDDGACDYDADGLVDDVAVLDAAERALAAE